MNRNDALTYISNKYAVIAAYSNVLNEDTEQGYKQVIDNALLVLGFTTDQLATAVVPESDTIKYKALLDYFALDKFTINLSMTADVSTGTPAISVQRSIYFNNVRALKKDAEKVLEKLGIDMKIISSIKEAILYYDYI